jgi:anionic cell wall polymer biosynthesis LytR-Cps2A-Psr (LCP) family protein
MPASRSPRRRTIIPVAVFSLVLALPAALISPALSLAAATSDLGALLLTATEGSSISYGKDGRLTVLLLGSDYRPTLSGERTDVIMVMTINPNTGKMAAVSIPRDIAQVRLPNGSVFKGRINGIYAYYKKSLGKAGALARLETIVEHNLQVEIDHHALIRFNGLRALVDEVNGLRVNIGSEIRDPKFWDDPNKPRGIYFPAAGDWPLKGTSPMCNGLYRTKPYTGQTGYKCERALVYVRSRKGAGNSDFVRARRQQGVVAAAIDKVINRGDGDNLVSLLGRANNLGSDFYSNIPLTLANAKELYGLLNGAVLPADRRAVLKPTTYATRITGTATYRLNLAAVRNLTAAWFAPVS